MQSLLLKIKQKKYGTKNQHVEETNEVVMMPCKSITAKLLTVLGILIEPSASIATRKGYVDAYIYIMQPT